MGAPTIRIRPSRPLAGVTTFYTTNGHAEFTADSRWLVIYDGRLVVACEWASGCTFHFTPPVAVEGWLLLRQRRSRGLKSVTVGASSVRVSYETAFHTQKEEQELVLGGAGWSVGLGSAVDGKFPSAYESDIEAIRNAT